MEDASEAAKPHKKSHKPISPWWVRLINYVKRERIQRKAKRDHEEPADRAARGTFWATVWIAGFTSVLAAVGILQWKEMDDSGAQTDRMIRLYRSQVAQLSKQAGNTHDLALAAKAQSEQTKTMARQAVIQARIARDSLEITQRAYLSDKEPETPFSGFGLLKIPIENYGHVPSQWFTIHMNYEWIRHNFETGGLVYLDDRIIDVKKSGPVYPGPNNSAIVVMVPQKGNAPQTLSADEEILVRARITYDTGFGKTDILGICDSFLVKDKKWKKCGGGGGGVDIDLGEAVPRKIQNSKNPN